MSYKRNTVTLNLISTKVFSHLLTDMNVPMFSFTNAMMSPKLKPSPSVTMVHSADRLVRSAVISGLVFARLVELVAFCRRQIKSLQIVQIYKIYIINLPLTFSR